MYQLLHQQLHHMAGITQKIEKALGKDDLHARIDQIDQAISMEADDVTSEEEKNIRLAKEKAEREEMERRLQEEWG